MAALTGRVGAEHVCFADTLNVIGRPFFVEAGLAGCEAAGKGEGGEGGEEKESRGGGENEMHFDLLGFRAFGRGRWRVLKAWYFCLGLAG